jgi:hypothetical protein
MLGLAFLSQCRKSIARQWLWAASCDLGWIGLSALLIAARPHSAAGKLCLVVFVLLFVRHVLWAKILRKSGIAKAVSPKTGEGPSAARVRPVGVDITKVKDRLEHRHITVGGGAVLSSKRFWIM